MELKVSLTISISSILAFALIAAATPTVFENVLTQEENTTGMSQDQTSVGGDESTAFNPEEIIKKEARGLGDADLGEVQEVTGEFINAKRYCR